jgi:hypothetical protein
VFLDPNLVLPQVAKVVLVEEAFVDPKLQSHQFHLEGIMALHRPNPRSGIAFLLDPKSMQVKIGPSESDLDAQCRSASVLSERTRNRRHSIGWMPQIHA